MDRNRQYVERVRSMGYVNPFFDRETVIDNAVGVDLSVFNGVVHLSTVRALTKGKGDGTRVMKRLMDLADEMGVTLEGIVEPFGQGGMSKTALMRWYKSFGFVKKYRHGDEIVRRPKRAQEARELAERIGGLLRRSA